MKIFKTVIYTLLVLIVFSCNTNDEFLEIETIITEVEMQSSAKTDFEHDGPKVKNPNYTYTKIEISYEPGTTEYQKQLHRFSHGLDMGLFSWEQNIVEPNKEIWVVEFITEADFNVAFSQPIYDEPEITSANYLYSY